MAYDARGGGGPIPPEAIAYLQAVRRYYQPGVTRPPRNADIAASHNARLEPRTWDRRKHDLRSGKWGDRDWIEIWPPPPDWHPSWETLVPQPNHAEPVEPDGMLHLVVDEAYDKNGKLVERRIIRTLGHLGSVAAAYVYMLLDLSDGRLDGAFRGLRFAHLALQDLVSSLCRVLT